MNRYAVILVLLITACALAQTAVKTKPPTEKVPLKSCVTEQCHVDVKDHKVLHGPVNVNACDACHTLVDAEKHTYKFARDPDEMCGFCHVVETKGAKYVHEPLKTGECSACHSSHGGFDKNFLKSKSMSDLCQTCHQDVTGGAKQVHGPVAAGACGACHQPHTSEQPNLLVQSGRELCVSCHREMDQQLKKARFVHEPVKQECQQCHDAHASDHVMITKAAPSKLCTDGCHEPVKRAVFEAKYQHSAVTENAACVNCHTAHGGELAALMKSSPVEVCQDCHNEPVKAGDRTIAAVTDITDKDLFKHGPVRDGSCGGCHNVHGSDHTRLLTNDYSPNFYESFETEKYALCFECHDKRLVLEPTTRGLTKFRDGDVNLHYVHVNKDKRGRACRACHSTHASQFPVHVRESVPYGNWQLPINYEQTKNGGTCSPGCHEELPYSRTGQFGPEEAEPEVADEAPETEEATETTASDTETQP